MLSKGCVQVRHTQHNRDWWHWRPLCSVRAVAMALSYHQPIMEGVRWRRVHWGYKIQLLVTQLCERNDANVFQYGWLWRWPSSNLLSLKMFSSKQDLRESDDRVYLKHTGNRKWGTRSEEIKKLGSIALATSSVTTHPRWLTYKEKRPIWGFQFWSFSSRLKGCLTLSLQ